MEDRISMGSHSDGNSFHNQKVDGFSINGKYSRKYFFNHLLLTFGLNKAFFQSTLPNGQRVHGKILAFTYQGQSGRKSNFTLRLQCNLFGKCLKIFNVYVLYYKSKLEFIGRNKFWNIPPLINCRKQYFSC